VNDATPGPSDAIASVMDVWPEPALLADPDGRILAVSAAGRALAGLDVDGGPQSLHDMVGVDLAGRLLSEAGEKGEYEILRGEADGGVRVLHARTARLPDGRVLVSLTEVGAGHRVRRHLEQAERLASVGELLCSVAHELTNPLTTVLGYSEVLLAEEHPGLPRDDIERIRSEASRCRRIVSNLLDLSRSDAMETRPLMICDVVAKVIEFREYAAGVSDVALTDEQEDDLPAVEGDFHRLVQAILNLVTNAEYAVSGRASGRRVVIRTRTAGDGVALEVEDNGPGVADHLKDAVFQPFFTTKPRGRGTGLGLSLVKATAESHGGTIRVEDAPGSGARFVLELPALEL